MKSANPKDKAAPWPKDKTVGGKIFAETELIPKKRRPITSTDAHVLLEQVKEIADGKAPAASLQLLAYQIVETTEIAKSEKQYRIQHQLHDRVCNIEADLKHFTAELIRIRESVEAIQDARLEERIKSEKDVKPPRIWRGISAKVGHWLLFSQEDPNWKWSDNLGYGAVFVPGNQPKPVGLGKGKLFECSTIDWIEDNAQKDTSTEQLSASEAVYGLMGWLTSLETPVILGASHWAGPGAILADRFCKNNNLPEPRDNYSDILKDHCDEPDWSKSKDAAGYAMNLLGWEDQQNDGLSKPEKLTTEKALAHLLKAIEKDDDYRHSWVANIAVQFQDAMSRLGFVEGDHARFRVHKASNEAAENFINMMINTSKPETESSEEMDVGITVTDCAAVEKGPTDG